MYYNVKTIDSKSTLEVWVHSRPIFTGFTVECASSGSRRTFEELDEDEQAEAIKKKKKYYRNKRWEISRLINMNYDNATKFFTMTFAENQKDVEIANKHFDKFIKRLKYQLEKKYDGTPLKYIATWERQKRGAIHYHLVLFGFPYIKRDGLAEIWSHGFVRINKIKHIEVHKIGMYVSKYFAKDLDLKESKKKAFFKSQNLAQPIVEKLDIDDLDILKDTIAGNAVIFSKEYGNNFFIDYNEIEDKVFYYQIDKTKKAEHFPETKQFQAMSNL